MAKPNPGQEKMRYEVITQPSPDSEDDLLLPIPQALLDRMGWKEGDNIEIGFDEAGRYVLKKTRDIQYPRKFIQLPIQIPLQ